MCLLVLLYKQVPEYPLVLGANRDEYFERPSTSPMPWESTSFPCSFLAPRDERAGGTWIGLNSRGAAAAITNRKGEPFRKEAPSRGMLCSRALSFGGAEAMLTAALEQAGSAVYNSFNLLLADRAKAYLLTGAAGRLDCRALEPGVFSLTNEHELNQVRLPASLTVLEKDRPVEEQLIERLSTLLRSHQTVAPDGFTACKHFGDRGTRSSTIILVGSEKARFLFSKGAPCETPYEDFSAGAQRLLRGAGREAL